MGCKKSEKRGAGTTFYTGSVVPGKEDEVPLRKHSGRHIWRRNIHLKGPSSGERSRKKWQKGVGVQGVCQVGSQQNERGPDVAAIGGDGAKVQLITTVQDKAKEEGRRQQRKTFQYR